MTNPHDNRALDCARARDLIDAFLLDELDAPDAARLAAHVKGCAACAAEIGGSTRVLGLLGALPTPRSTPDLDERILLAVIADRQRRHERRSWLSDLRMQVLRGAMRTTSTLLVTIVTVALLGGAFVFAASQVVIHLPQFQPVARATLAPVATPTLAPETAAPTAPPATPTATPRPSSGGSVTPTPEPTPVPSPSAEPSATPEPSASSSPSAEPSASPSPSVEPSPSATPEPTPSPTPSPSPTDKRRTPPPSESPSP